MGMTGQGTSISASTADLSGVKFISITPPSGESSPIPAPTLDLPVGSGMPKLPGDLIDYECQCVVEYDPDFDWSAIVNVADTFTVTYPLPAGASTPADDEFPGFVTGYPIDPVATGERMQATVMLAVNGDVTKTPSA